MTHPSKSLGLFTSLFVTACIVHDPGEASTTGGPSTSSAEQGHEATGVPTTGDLGVTSTTTATSTGGAGETATTDTGSDATSGAPTSATTTPCGDCNFTCEDECEDTGDAVSCDVLAQDCPEGEKCAPYADDGGSSWNATRCVPVTGAGAPGDGCTAEDGVTGVDDCGEGSMCWDVDEQGVGQCVALCTGTQAAPTCANEASFNCAVINEFVINVCLPSCGPLVQDCAGDDLCIPLGSTFVCVFDDSGAGGQIFGGCELANGCDKGLVCAHPAAAKECDPNAGGCCLPMCDLSDVDAVCPGEGTSCLPLLAEDQAPPEFANIGLCVVPE